MNRRTFLQTTTVRATALAGLPRTIAWAAEKTNLRPCLLPVQPESFDLQKILESKRAQRRELAARPVAEKLRMLDALRERALTLRGATAPGHVDTDALREEAAPYRTKQA